MCFQFFGRKCFKLSRYQDPLEAKKFTCQVFFPKCLLGWWNHHVANLGVFPGIASIYGWFSQGLIHLKRWSPRLPAPRPLKGVTVDGSETPCPTTWHVWNPANNGIFTISSTVCVLQWEDNSQIILMQVVVSIRCFRFFKSRMTFSWLCLKLTGIFFKEITWVSCWNYSFPSKIDLSA